MDTPLLQIRLETVDATVPGHSLTYGFAAVDHAHPPRRRRVAQE